MKKMFDEEFGEKYYLSVSNYSNNRLYIQVDKEENNKLLGDYDYMVEITKNIPEISMDKQNQIYLANDISGGIKYKLLDNGIISKTINIIDYNGEKYHLVEVDFEKLKEYDKDGVENFLQLYKNQEMER